MLIALSYGRLAGPQSGVPSACVTSDSLLPNSKPSLAQGRASNDQGANIRPKNHPARGIPKCRNIKQKGIIRLRPQWTNLQPQSVVTKRGVGVSAFKSSTPGGAQTPTITPAE